MTLSDPTDTQPAVKQARKRGRSVEEKRQQSEERVRRHRSTTASTAQADTVHERDRLAKQRSRSSKENTPPPSQQESTPSREATTAVPSPQCRPMTAVPAAVSGQRHVQPLVAMRTPASRRSDAPMPAAMTDSSARKGAALGIPPPADRVGGTHQSLLLGLDNEKALDAVYYREASLPIYKYTLIR
jgi:hypothetical protein